MRFLADMGISLKTVQYLKNRGHDIVHLRDEGLQRLSDDKIVLKAENEKRIILTCDLDFGTIMAFSGDIFPSIIIFRLSDFRPENINKHIDKILLESSKILEKGAVLSVNDTTYRVRILPISN
jgi:predicted nuclease of predicted toxin-antitoxin system